MKGSTNLTGTLPCRDDSCGEPSMQRICETPFVKGAAQTCTVDLIGA